MLEENCFRTAQKTTDREPPSNKIGNRVYFKDKQAGMWDMKWRPGLSSFQHCMHDCTHQYNMGEQRVSTVPACIKSLPHLSPLDDHSPCIIEKYGEAMEAVHQTYSQNTSASHLSPMEAFNTNSTVISNRSRTQQSN